MSRQYWEEMLSWTVADGTAVSNSATETIIFPNITIPANFMQDGRALKIIAFGRYSNVVTSVPTLTFFIRWGGIAGTVICRSPAIVTSATAITSAPWELGAIIQTRTNGSSGTLFGMGQVTMTTGTAPTFGTVTNYGVKALLSSTGTTVPAAVTVDLTADTALTISAQWSAANAANAFTGHIYTVEALN